MRRRGLFLGVVGLGALVGALGADAQKLVDERIFKTLDAPVAIGARLTTEPLELEDGTQVTLEVSPFQVFAPGAQIVVHGKDGDILIPPPSDRWFTGHVAGDPTSIVVLARGRSVRGFVFAGGRVSLVGPERNVYSDGLQGRTQVRTFNPQIEAPNELLHYTCGTESLPLPREALALNSPGISAACPPFSSVMYYAGIAVETDYELYAKFNSTTNLSTYVGDLFAAISALYQRDVLVTLQVNYLSIWTTSSDPWSAGDTLSGLYEFGDYWHANHAGLSRVTAHFLSGKGLGGGIAWLSVLCRTDFSQNGHWGGGYGFTASLAGAAPANLTTTYWDFMAVTHEIGHNFSSPHTHCYSPPVDMCCTCATESQCGQGVGQGPVPPEKGTIMSYCHLVGGYGAIKMFLGVPTESSNAVLTQIRCYVESQASCFGSPVGPVETGISPSSGTVAGGTPVTISGSGFSAPVAVKFGGATATSVVVVNANTITAVTPSHIAGPVDVTVRNSLNYQEFLLAGGFTYGAPPIPPTVTAISPTSGPTAGKTSVTITGTGFAGGATVSIGGIAATSVVVVNATTITAMTGTHAAGTVSVVVTNPDTTSGTLPNAFTYLAPPWATRFFTVTPCRVVDTRWADGAWGGPALAANGAQRVFTVTGTCGIPVSARAVSANVTVTLQSAAGSVAAYPGNLGSTGTVTISFPAAKTRTNNAVLYLATDGTGSIGVENDSTSTVQFILDVNGYFQ